MSNSSALFLAGKEVVLIIWNAAKRELLLFLPETIEGHPVLEHNAQDIKEVLVGEIDDVPTLLKNVGKDIAEVVCTQLNWINNDLVSLTVLTRESVMTLVANHQMAGSLVKYDKYVVLNFLSRSECKDDQVIFWPNRVHLRLTNDTSYIRIEKRR